MTVPSTKKLACRIAGWAGGVLWVCAAPLPAQIQVTGSGPGGLVRIFNTDAAVLEAQEPRKDLPCTVVPMKAARLGFDLRFHSAFDVTLPLRELSGSEDLLTILFRVTPASQKSEPVYFSQRISVPSIEPDARGDAYLHGAFDLGEGSYHVDWLMRDRAERVCSSYWEVEAEVPPRDKELNMAIPAGVAQASDREPFKEEPPIERDGGSGPLSVKVIVNFAPQNSRSTALRPIDTGALVSILRNISREPRIARFSLVAFNMQEQRVLYRQEGAGHIDFPTLGDAVQKIKLGIIDLKRLGQKHGDAEFLTTFINEEISRDNPDAVIFAGPKLMLEGFSADVFRQLGEPDYPVFYMNYNLNPQANPWRDAIGSAVKALKGYEYTISRPRDLWFAWTDIMSRIVRFKVDRRTPSGSSQ